MNNFLIISKLSDMALLSCVIQHFMSGRDYSGIQVKKNKENQWIKLAA